MPRFSKMGVSLLMAAAVAGSAAAQEVVNVETQEELNKLVGEEEAGVLVEFFAPWCGHCKALAPEFEKAATELDGLNVGQVAAVDCTTDAGKETCTSFGVRGFPTLKYFRGSTDAPVDYDQARKADAIVKFMKKQAQPAVTELEADAVDAFAADESVKVIAFVADGADTEAFKATAEKMRNDYSFGIVSGADATKVVVKRDFDGGDVDFDGDFADGDALAAFVTENSFPLFGEIGPENYSKYLDRGLPFLWFFIDNSADTADTISAEVADIAKDHRQLSFVKLDGERWGAHAKTFGLNADKLPAIAIEDRDARKNYVFEGDFSAAEFKTFVEKYAAGELVANVKSEDEPESNDGPVFVATGNNFEANVQDASKDVLIEFYAPWCGHCKSLAPKYEELGEKYGSDSNVVIAKLDATANDQSLMEVQGFPTIALVTAEDNEVIEYNGARTVEAMAEFIEANRKSKAAEAEAEAEAKEEGHDEL